MVTSKNTNPIKHFITSAVEKPQVFFTADEKVKDHALSVAKYFYDTAKQSEPMEFSPFPELLIAGFEADQIWEEIASQNEPFLHYCQSTLAEFSRKRKRDIDEHNVSDNEEAESSSASEESLDNFHDDNADEHEFSGIDEDEEMFDEEDERESEEEEDEEAMADEQVEEDEESNEFRSSTKPRSEVDDDFFDLEKFNKWTEDQEELDMMSDREDDEDEAIDYDNDLEALDESEEEDEDDLAQASEMTFKDFFAPPRKQGAPAPKPKKRVTFAEPEPSEDEDEDEDREEIEEEEEEEDKPTKRGLFDDDEENDDDQDDSSAYQKRLQKLQQEIDQFEQENISDKHWTLKGETSAKSRPSNSLLEEDIEFEQSVKPVPVITEEITNALEEIIKKRILENQFDDVVRKEDPAERPFLPSKRIEISDEQSKKSLAELYEEDYIKQKTGDTTNEKDEKLAQEHNQITEMFNTLCYKLDALSNFHFTPKQVTADVKIVSDAPAISMEEVIPVNVSDATLLAPEEVYEKKKAEIKDKTEMSQEERKRAHAKKKKMKRKEKALKEREMKIIHKQNPGLGNKHAKMKAVKELLGQKNVEIIKNK
ncbi:U3 small nucleolar ribonucleoprotein complex, subunit Mpp10 [Dichotomocladium elegans]|nr:U3 small nucleolar ribonucleoprotein complex, subunit Mpp10 [Dichotomocladium elegans]